MDKVKGLICRECGSEYPADPIHVCEFCFGPLEVNYNYENIKKKLTRKEIEKGPKSLWRYIDLLPVDGDALVGSHAAEAGLKCYVFIPGDLEAGKVLGSLVYNPTLVSVNGNYDDVNRLCSEIAGEYKWAFVNINIRPYYAEGSKTLAYE